MAIVIYDDNIVFDGTDQECFDKASELVDELVEDGEGTGNAVAFDLIDGTLWQGTDTIGGVYNISISDLDG